MSSRHRLVPVVLVALASGCDDSGEPSGPKRAAPAPTSAPSPAPVEKPQDNFIIGRKTTDIRNAAVEQKKGAVATPPRITAKDPITLQGNAYVTIIGKTSILNIQHTMDLYKATNDKLPANFEEFKKEIIEANNISLPKLPYYQEYGYDEKEHKLVILEYPDRKQQ